MAKGIKTGGRVKGVPNRATADIKALAMSYTEEAFEALIGVARNSESDAARVAAIKEILDRGYGKSRQAVEHSGADGEKLVIQIVRLADNSAS